MSDLRTQLMTLLESGSPPPEFSDFSDRPTFILAPRSHLGKLFAETVIGKLPNVVAVVDDYATEETMFGVPRWSLHEFSSKVTKYNHAVAVDFSVGTFSAALFKTVCQNSGVEWRDFVMVHAEFGLPAVFESARDYRKNTLARIDDFLNLESRLADQLSRDSLYAMLLFRLTYDRSYIHDVFFGTTEEYFADSKAGKSFILGENEYFCDCGAHQGTVIARFLGATNWRFDGIAAFEPDKQNFRRLQKYCLLPLKNLKFINKALSDRHETLRFVETGTVSSYVSDQGNVSVETTRLDDELDRLTFLKMDVEGFEARTLYGGAGLIKQFRPRMSIAGYHYATDILEIIKAIDELAPGYHIRLRQHFNYYYDSIIYASPRAGWN